MLTTPAIPRLHLRQQCKPTLCSLTLFAVSACGGGGETPQVSSQSSSSSSSASAVDIFTSSAGFVSPTSVAPLINNFRSFGRTGDNFIDATTQGSSWIVNNGPLTFAVANGFNGELWDDPSFVSEKLAQAMGQLAYFTDLQVQNVGVFSDPNEAANAGATIVVFPDSVIMDASDLSEFAAAGFFPSMQTIDGLVPTLDVSGYLHSAGDMVLNISNAGVQALRSSDYEPSSEGFTLLLHELGHALGLKHPFDDGGSGRPTVDQAGLSHLDDKTYFNMAYDDVAGSTGNSPATFMVSDVLALMYLYGANMTTNAGNTTHILSNSSLRMTVWDGSGEDTVDLRSSSTDNLLVLGDQSSAYSGLVDVDVGYVLFDTPRANPNYPDIWLLGEYENVMMGSGNDRVFGDENNNVINLGSGNDYVRAGAGNDICSGGSGFDTFSFEFGSGNDLILDFEVGRDRIEFLDQNGNVDNSLATLQSGDNDWAMFVMQDGSSVVLANILDSQMVGLV